MINFEYFCLPALYVKDISSDVIHMVGTDAHDRLYLDANGNIQYLNLQSEAGLLMIILLFLMKTDIIKTICLSQKKNRSYMA